MSDEAYRRLGEVRAKWDPDGTFCSYLATDGASLNQHA
jgi:hypothetical protein